MSCADRITASVVVGLSLLVANAASAAVITRDFGIQVPAGTPVDTPLNVASSAFQQFDPALGTLTEIQTAFAGDADWMSSSAAPRLNLSLVVHGLAIVIGGEQYFFSPGSLSFSLGSTDRYLPELGSFIGAGATQVDLRILGSGGEFSTPLNSGSVSYVYDPRQTAVPEPGGVWLAGVGLLAMMAAGSRHVSRRARLQPS